MIDEWLRRWGGQWFLDEPRSEPLEAYFARVGTTPLDAAIAELCEAYAAADGDGRAAMRAAVGPHERVLHNLLGYPFRMASVLRRDARLEHVRIGALAITLGEGHPDWRDAIVALIVLRWAAERGGLAVRETFAAVADLASEQTARLIRSIPDRSAGELEYTVRQMTARDWREAFDAPRPKLPSAPDKL